MDEALRKLQPYFEKIPSVSRPKRHVPFKEKFGWTIAVLILYFVLSNIPLFGLSPQSIDLFARFRAFFAGKGGTIIALGIGPIVTASVIVQLLVGAGIIELDLTDPDDQAAYQDFQRFLVLVMIALEALPQILGGFIRPNLSIAKAFGVSPATISFLLFIQLFIGGVLIVYMDEVVSKWGIGSGVSLFILASISQAIVTGLINWVVPTNSKLPAGIIPRWIWIAQHMSAAQLLTLAGIKFVLIDGGVLALLTTAIIILLVVYAEGTRVEIPLSHSLVRGARGRYPLKLIYTSVLPMIFVRALQANIEIFGLMLYRHGVKFLGEYVGTQPVSGIMYLLNPIRGPNNWIPELVKANYRMMVETYHIHVPPPPDWMIFLHLLTDATILIIGGVLFSIFWMETSGMDPKTIADQLAKSGMQIPGFRKNPKVLERVLSRYIPKVTVVGGAVIGALTLIANMLGTIGHVTGTGLLLAVSIAYQYYEDLAKEQLTEMHPMIRRMLGEE